MQLRDNGQCFKPYAEGPTDFKGRESSVDEQCQYECSWI